MNDTDPAEAEVLSEDIVTFTFGDHTYEIPASADDLDINVLRAFAKEDLMGVVEGIFSERQFATLERRHREAHGGRFSAKDFKPLVDEVAKVYGFNSAGE